MFRRKLGASNASTVAPTQGGKFPTFRRLLGRLSRLPGRLPFLSRAWWKRNKRRVAAVCLALAALWTATNIYTSALLNRELEAIRGRGEPLTMAELAPPPVPDAQNAAVLYRRANAFLKNLKLTKDEDWLLEGSDFKTNKSMPPSQLSARRRSILQKCRPALEMIRQASRLPSCRFPTKWEQESAFSILFPDLAPLRHFARIMTANATQEAYNGQTTQAIEDVGVIYRISEHAVSDPLFISLLVGNAIENVGHAALAQVFEYSNLTPAQRSQVEAILPRADKEQQLARAMRGERAFSLSAFNKYLSSPQDVTQISDEDTNIVFSLLACVGQTLWMPILKLDEVWLLRSHPANSHPTPLQDVPPYAILTRIYLPVFARARDPIRKVETMRALAQIALDLNVYHTQNKMFPATMAQLETQTKTKLPLDLFSGKPFVYRRAKDLYVLYSVGRNKTDDDGHTEDDWNRARTRVQELQSSSWLATHTQWDDITWPPRKRN